MRESAMMFSFAVLAAAAFFCTGTYYSSTGMWGAIPAMLAFGICSSALFYRALQQYFSAQEETERARDERAQRSDQTLLDLLRQSRETQESGYMLVAEELSGMRTGMEALMRDVCQEVSSKLGTLTEQQQAVVQQCGELAQSAKDILNVCDINSRKAETGNQYLAQMAESQVEKEVLNRKLEDLYKWLKKIHEATMRVADAAEDLQKPLETLGEPLSATLERVMNDIEQQNKAQRLAMEQYKAMTTKDMQMLEQLARAVR